MSTSTLSFFSAITANWFKSTLGEPTPVQCEAWPAIAAGRHTLVSAPTGTGKTLSAFLVFIDRLKDEARKGLLKKELRLIYISPLKSLAGDIRENLRKPLNGIYTAEREANANNEITPFDITVAIRTGDTSSAERQKMVKSPPHILITTPESLYLLLTSMSGRKMLGTARAIIIDELHALIGSKRGAHLMLSIARLDRLCPEPLQRIGLSATIEPLSVAAEYLSPDEVAIAAPKMQRMTDIKVTSPLEDINAMQHGSIWIDIASAVYKCCEGKRSVIAFVGGRLFAEKLAYYVNEIAGKGFAYTHHGSVSKERRLEAEQALREGRLRLLCATSSMELGIDVGDIDQVLQIGCPFSISSTMQRLGRAGHNPGRVSVMHMFPRTAHEGLFCGLTAKVAREGGVEYSRPPRLCLDVLAQHLVSMATGDGYTVDDIMGLIPRAYPFRDVTREDVLSVLCMLAGDYEHDRDIPVRPRLLYDRINGRVEGDAYSRMLAVSTGGTIPDRGQFAVHTDNGAKIGELDEEFVFEGRVGDKFLLGSFAWKITSIQKDKVIVTQTNTEGAQSPFWKADPVGRSLQTSLAFGELIRGLSDANAVGKIDEALYSLGLDEITAVDVRGLLTRQIEATGLLPDDRTILVEHFQDDTGDHQLMIHSVFGRQVNAPLAILAQETAKRVAGADVGMFEDDNGFMLFPNGGRALPEGLLQSLSPETARPILESILPVTPLFNMNFRYNAARALLMGVQKAGRQPLWVQRMRGAEMLAYLSRFPEHPMIKETKRECLEDFWDLSGVEFMLKGIRSGAIRIREIYRETPSPMSLPLRRQAEAVLLYDYYPTPSIVARNAEYAVKQIMKQADLIAPEPEHLAKVSERTRLPEDEKQLHSLLMAEGDLIAGELEVPVEWLVSLAKQGRALYIEPGLWIAAEHEEEYISALEHKDGEARNHIVRRLLRYRGAKTEAQVADRYFWNEDDALTVLNTLCEMGSAVKSEDLYYHAELYDRARREAVMSRRKQIRTMPSECYAALLADRLRISAPPAEQLEASVKAMCGIQFQPVLWESVILPARVAGYRPAMLDALLAQGGYVWYIHPTSTPGKVALSFELYDDTDWDADVSTPLSFLDGEQKIVYEALMKRGASFTQGMYTLLGGGSPHEPLLELVERGLVHADSFVPVRQWMDKEKLKKATARQRVNSRVMNVSSGRWELSRPLAERSPEQHLERAFDRAPILCRETIKDSGISWAAALEILRVWEYTGRARRGYFIEGLSGAQFIKEKDFEGVMLALEQPGNEIVWISAIDPLQLWGRSLQHKKDRAFMCVPETLVALRAGLPVAVFERQGQVLRVFDEASMKEAVGLFARGYERRRFFPMVKRITVKQYPTGAAEALAEAGFDRVLQDFVLRQGYM